MKSLTASLGIGKWTAQYIAMRALGAPDAFPEGDLGLRYSVSDSKSLISSAELNRIAERWRPWRAYAACIFGAQSAPNFGCSRKVLLQTAHNADGYRGLSVPPLARTAGKDSAVLRS